MKFIRLPIGLTVLLLAAVCLSLLPNRAVQAQSLPNVYISDASLTEGDSGTAAMRFFIYLSAPNYANTVTVNYSTSANSARSGSDFITTSGTLSYSPGETYWYVDVPIVGDLIHEVTQTFNVYLGVIYNANHGNFVAVGTIYDNDPYPSISINNVSVNEASGPAVFTVSLNTISEEAVQVVLNTANVTATAGSDYTSFYCGSSCFTSITIPAGQLSRTVNVSISNDSLDEPDETFRFWVSNLPFSYGSSNVSSFGSSVTGTITDDDAPPTISINDVTVTEGDSGTTNASFTVSLSAPSGKTITVDYETADNTATTAGGDFSAASGTVTFAAGVTTQTVSVPLNGDTLDEVDETYHIDLSNPVNVTVLDGQGTGTITDDDAEPTVSINDVTVTEGDSGTTNAGFTVSLSAPSGKAITVDYATADNTATIAGGDYTAASGTVTFAAGVTTQTVNVPVNGDTLDEVDETYHIDLSNPVNVTVLDGQGTGTITDDDAEPTVSINDVTVTEGDSGTTNASFIVSLSAPSGKTITVDYATADNTATTAGGDFSAATGTVTFAAGVTTQTVSVPVNGDTLDEVDETYHIDLSSSVNATVLDGQGTGTITDDDAPPTISINDVTVTEGDSGTINASFTVSLSAASSKTITVDYATADNTATIAGGDYTAASGTVTFAAGVTTQTVNVPVNGDTLADGTESFFVNLSNAVNTTISDSQGVGTILDDDGQAAFSISDVTQAEGNIGTTDFIFTVTRSGNTKNTDTLDYATADGSATTADNDYVAASGILTFNPGVTTQTLDVTVNGDVIAESDETFFINLSNASALALISDNQGTGSIVNDEAAPGLSVNDVVYSEPDVSGYFTVTLNPVNSAAVTVDYTLVDGTGINGVHYVAGASGTLTFAPGIGSQTVSFAIPDNDAVSGDRTFSLTLGSSSGPGVTRGTGTATIIDNELHVIEVPAPPPAPACTNANFEDGDTIRTNFTNDADRAGLNCRVIASDGVYMTWLGSPLTSDANIGNRTVLDLGVIAAVDVFSPGGARGFAGDVNICLKGYGYMIFLDANNAPRVPQLWSAWTTDAFPGYTCTTLYGPGTVVLVRRKP